MSERPDADGLSRRALLLGAATTGVAAAGAAAIVAGAQVDAGGDAPDAPVRATGEHQAGVDRPAAPQQHCIVAVLDADLGALRSSLAALGDQIVAVTAAPHGLADLTPDGTRDLTVTVGLGADALRETAHPELAELVELPEFAGDAQLTPAQRGGALLVSVNASDPSVLEPVLSSLLEQVAGAQLRWSEFGYRGTPVDGVGRNPFGYFDGIIGPRTASEFTEDVWIADGPLAGGSICVVRRFRLDVEGFRELSPEQRDATVGRVQSTGAPLSGGVRDDEVDLNAKSADGTLLIPLRAHARAAHPSFTGSPLMLRRSYSFRDSDADHGHVFISFQNDVQTFARTQLRLDETDDLMRFATPTATAGFAVLPGIRRDAPLGSTLF